MINIPLLEINKNYAKSDVIENVGKILSEREAGFIKY